LTVKFRDVKEDAQALTEMLRLTNGSRRVPVLLEGGKISIGFGGA
jgi:glutaredoxin